MSTPSQVEPVETGWREVVISEIAEVVGGSTPKTSVSEYWDGDIPWVTPADLSKLDGHFIGETPRNITSLGLANSGAKVLPPGSVLLSSRAPIGHVAVTTVPMATNQGFKSLVPDENQADAKYLYWWLRTHKSYLQNLGNGATFKEVSKAVVSGVRIPLPPLPEQRRIADILDRADDLRSKRRRALAILDTLTEVTFDTFVREGGADIGQKVTLGEAADIQTGPFGSLLHREDYVPGGIPLVNPMHIRDGQVEVDPEYSISDEKFESLRTYELRKGDVVLGRRGEMGRAAEVLDSSGGLLCGTGSMILRPRAGVVTGAVLAMLLRSPEVRGQLEQQAQGVTMLNLNQSIVAGISVSLPPFADQLAFARVKTMLHTAEGRRGRHLAKLDELFASLQHRAFSGQL